MTSTASLLSPNPACRLSRPADDADPVPCCPAVDAAAEREAGLALANSFAVPTRAVRAVVFAHVLTLSGQLSWHFQRDAALLAVREIRGVAAIRNAIHVQLSLTAGTAR